MGKKNGKVKRLWVRENTRRFLRKRGQARIGEIYDYLLSFNRRDITIRSTQSLSSLLRTFDDFEYDCRNRLWKLAR